MHIYGSTSHWRLIWNEFDAIQTVFFFFFVFAKLIYYLVVWNNLIYILNWFKLIFFPFRFACLNVWDIPNGRNVVLLVLFFLCHCAMCFVPLCSILYEHLRTFCAVAVIFTVYCANWTHHIALSHSLNAWGSHDTQ